MTKTLTILFIMISIAMSCNKKANQLSAFDAFEKKQYATAIDLYIDKYNNGKENQAVYAYKIAKSYIELKNYKESFAWSEKAYKLSKIEQHSLLFIESLIKEEFYGQALLMIDDHLRSFGENKLLLTKKNQIRQATKWKESSHKSDFRISGVSFNSAQMDFSPVYYNDQIVFTSDRLVQEDSPIYLWTGNEYTDLYILEGNTVEPFSIVTDTDFNDGNMTFNITKDLAFFTRCDQMVKDEVFCKLMFTELIDGVWNSPQRLDFFGASVNEVHPCLIESDEVLIFAANKLDALGGYDLYYAVKDGNTWGEAFSMPDYINTVGDELFPTSYKDTLYFSSNRLLGMGGLDIFKVHLKDKKWSIPKNLLPPINSGYDDFSFVINPSFEANSKALKSGMFSSNRKGGNGLDDIYQFVQTRSEKEVVDSLPLKKNEVNVFVLLKFMDELAKPIESVKIESSQLKTSWSDDNGRFFFKAAMDVPYDLNFQADKKLNVSFDFRINNEILVGLKEDTTIIYEFEMLGQEKGKEIVLDNIYYEYDQYELTKEAKKSLRNLIKILNDNPRISIELGAHTDCRGETIYNQALSQKRAQSVVDFLILNGIDAQRLVAKGYGESKLLNSCVCELCDESEHQINRRTSFTIMF